MFRNEALASEARAVSEIAMDVSEVLIKLDLPEGRPQGLKVAYHAACSLQARPADQDLSQGPVEARGLQGGRARRQSPVLWLGRDLQT